MMPAGWAFWWQFWRLWLLEITRRPDPERERLHVDKSARVVDLARWRREHERGAA